MKKFFITVIVLIVVITGLLPFGVGFGAEYLYSRFIGRLNQTLEDKGQPPIQIKKYERGYFKSNAVLTQKQQVGSGSGNTVTIPMTVVIKDTIWHLPWLIYFGEYQDKIVKWENWKNFELPLTFIQNDSIQLYFSQPTTNALSITPGSEAVFSASDYIRDTIPAKSFFYNWFPWWPHINPSAIANNVLTINQNLDVQWKMWFKHDISIGSSAGKDAIQINDLAVFSNTSTQALAKTSESVRFSSMKILSDKSANQPEMSMRINNFSHEAVINPENEAQFAEITTALDKVELNTVFRIEDLKFTQVIQKQRDSVNLQLSNSAKRLRIEPTLTAVKQPTKETKDASQDVSSKTNPTMGSSTTYQPIIVNLSLMNMPFSDAFLHMLTNTQAIKTDPDYMENIFKKILENKPELIINQFTFGFPEGIMEMKGKLGFSDKTDVVSLLRDPNQLSLLRKSLDGQLTLNLPKQRVDEMLKNRIQMSLVSEMIANTPLGAKLKAMTVPERNQALDSIATYQLNTLIEKKLILPTPEKSNLYTIELSFKGGDLLVNGVVMTDQFTQLTLPPDLITSNPTSNSNPPSPSSGGAEATPAPTTGTPASQSQ